MTAHPHGSRSRSSMLESLRAYGRERLEDSASVTRVMRRFADHYLRAAQEVRRGLQGGPQQEVVEAVTADLENYRAAMAWLADWREWNDYLRLAGGIWRFWDITGAAGEAIYWLERGLQQDAAIRPEVRARACTCLGESLWRRGAHPGAEALQRQALALYLDCEDPAGVVIALTNPGGVAFARSDRAAARTHWERALAMARDCDSERQVGILLNNLGLVADGEGDLAGAEELLRESVAKRRAIGDRAGLSSSLVNLAMLAGKRGDDADVRALCAEAIELAGSPGQRLQMGAALEEISRADAREGDFAQAESHARGALALFTEIGHAPDAARMRATLATLAQTSIRRSESYSQHGQALTKRQGIGDADGGAIDSRGSQAAAPLSRREATVMELLAEGCTNREVAARLRLSIRTVERHAVNAYARLGARRRTNAIRRTIELQRTAGDRI